jgi:L-threonate 2-dehydrogenase
MALDSRSQRDTPMTEDSSRNVAVIGLGSMGYGMARSLLRAGFRVNGYDVRPQVLERFAMEGGTPVASPAEAARGAGIVAIVVVTADQTEATLFGESGVVTTLAKGAVLMTCATVPPLYAEGVGKRLAERGYLHIDAPLSGGAARAAQGKVTVMASGSPEAFTRAKAFFEATTERVYNLGTASGIGSRVKLINQLLAGVHIAASAEAMALAIKVGADPRTVYDVICNSAGASWMFQNRVPHILDGDYTPLSAVNIFVKDLGIVLDTARTLGFPTPLTSVAHQLFTMAAAHGHGAEDDAAVIKVYEALAGISLPGHPET